MLTKETVEKAMPPSLKGSVTQSLVDQINNATSDPEIAQNIRDNFVSFTTVLKDGKYSTEHYLNAVKYVSYKLMGNTNFDAYCKTFPQKYQDFVSKGVSNKDISAYVAAFAKGKLVNAIMEQTHIPMWIVNQEIYQRAINTQVDLMDNAQSEKVRCDAANSILTHLAKPKEAANALINIDMRSDGMDAMKDMITVLAQKQLEAINAGVPTKDIAEQKLIVGEVIPNGVD